MPIEKFHKIEDMPEPAIPEDPEKIADRIAFVWEMARAIAPLDWPHGVRKYRTIEDANLDRDEYIKNRARASRRPA